jgi:clan AA aspartic protease (TIGR02281 family)
MLDDPTPHVTAEDRPLSARPGKRSPWESGGDRSLGRTLAIGGGLLAIVAGIGVVAHLGVDRVLEVFGRQPTIAELTQRIGNCERERDWACVESGWTSWLKQRPDDVSAIANLGMALNRENRHAEAAVQFKRAIDAGEGAYDLFAYYADSLRQTGRDEEAIDWSYRALSIDPRLVDVRGDLARLLVARHRPFEALSLLESFDEGSVALGHPAYFAGQRIAIESGLAASAPAPTEAPALLRLPAFYGHYFAPVAIGGARRQAFMVDTGATRLSIGLQMLADSKASYRVTEPQVEMVTADGRRILAQGIVIESLQVGPFELRDVPAVACRDCKPLLGESVLSRFDLQSTRVQGVEFMSLAPRAHAGA